MKANKERKGKHNFIFKRSEEGNQMHLSFINLSSYKKGGKKIVLKIPKIVQGFIFYLKKKKKSSTRFLIFMAAFFPSIVHIFIISVWAFSACRVSVSLFTLPFFFFINSFHRFSTVS